MHTRTCAHKAYVMPTCAESFAERLLVLQFAGRLCRHSAILLCQVGTSAAPLRKSLMDSGLGQALIGGGLQGDLRQPIFSIGLKGVDPADAAKACTSLFLLSKACLVPADYTFQCSHRAAPTRTSSLTHRHELKPCSDSWPLLRQVEELIESTLTQCAKDGFTSSAIEAALNTTEFHLRENNTGRFPRGLSLMLRAMGNWIYDKDPYEALQWTEPLNAFKVRQSTL